jgi:hypothetical protein
MKHPIIIEKYNGTMEELVNDLSQLNYTSLKYIFDMLAVKIAKDAQEDFSKGRVQLSKGLMDLAEKLSDCAILINPIWKICKNHMDLGKK